MSLMNDVSALHFHFPRLRKDQQKEISASNRKEKITQPKDLTPCFITSSILFSAATLLLIFFLRLKSASSSLCFLQLFYFLCSCLISWASIALGEPKNRRTNREKYFKKQPFVVLQGLIVASAIAALLELMAPTRPNPSWTIFGIPGSFANLTFQSVTFLILKIQERLIEKSH